MNENGTKPLLGAIEAGGTKYVCAVARDPRTPLVECRFPTTANPVETIRRAANFFRESVAAHGEMQAMGVGTFGPADVHPKSPGYGSILTTPKEGWSGFNVAQTLREHLDRPVPIAFDTDVNAAVLAEAQYGAGINHRHVAYLTIGTGIGGSFLTDGSLLRGRMHTEVGHLVMPDFDREYGKSTQVCPFHESCWEGRASGPSLTARWGSPGEELPPDHAAWELEAKYLAAGCVALTATWSPEVIILGGGVPQVPGLIGRIRREFARQAGEYWSLPDTENYLVLPQLEQQAGIIGALLMAQHLLDC